MKRATFCRRRLWPHRFTPWARAAAFSIYVPGTTPPKIFLKAGVDWKVCQDCGKMEFHVTPLKE